MRGGVGLGGEGGTFLWGGGGGKQRTEPRRKALPLQIGPPSRGWGVTLAEHEGCDLRHGPLPTSYLPANKGRENGKR